MTITNNDFSVSFNLYDKEIDQFMSLDEISHHIKNNTHLKALTQKIRSANNKEYQHQLKTRLPIFYPAIYLPLNKKVITNPYVRSTGLIHFDVDIYQKEQSDELADQLINKIPSIAYLYRSPRNGIKFAIKTNFNETSFNILNAQYKAGFQQISQYLQQEIPALILDPATSNISQSSFFSYDENMFINHEAQSYKIKNVLPTVTTHRKYSSYRKNINHEKQQVLQALSYIPHDLSYDERFKINIALLSELGEEAISILLKHWQVDSQAKLTRDLKQQYQYTQKLHHQAITIATLFYIAQQNGFSFKS